MTHLYSYFNIRLFSSIGDYHLLTLKRSIMSKTNGPVNLDQVVSYPESKTSKMQITCVEVRSEQTSKKFDVKIVKGGINQSGITLQVKSMNTTYQKLSVTFYGKPWNK
jgi:Transcription activator MBF2